MKKFALLAIALGALCVGASCQSKKVTPKKAISIADVVSLAILNRNANKECVPLSELVLLQKIVELQKEFCKVAGEKIEPLALSGRLCPCPPNGFCPCDSSYYAAIVSVKTLQTNATLVSPEGKEKIELTKIVTSTGAVHHEVPAKVKDGDYKLVFSVHFGGDPAPTEFEVPAYIRKGIIKISKR